MLCPNIALLDTLQKIQRSEVEEMAAANLPLLASRICSSNSKDPLFFFFNLPFIYLSELGLSYSAWASLVSIHGL